MSNDNNHRPEATFVSTVPAQQVFGRGKPHMSEDRTEWSRFELFLGVLIFFAAGYLGFSVFTMPSTPQTFVTPAGVVSISPEAIDATRSLCANLRDAGHDMTPESPCAALLRPRGLW